MMPPSYPNPPDPAAPPAARVRARRLLGRQLAAVLAKRPDPPPEPERILLIRPDHLGDLLFLGPALRWLRRALPGAELALALGPWAVPALPALAGSVDRNFAFPFPGFERGASAGLPARWLALLPLAARLREQRFDTALILRPDHWWGAMLAALAGIPRRLGYETPETTPWLTLALPLPREHAAASNLRLVGTLAGAPPTLEPETHPLRFALQPDDEAAVARLLQALGRRPGQPLAIIHPGAGAAVKLWEKAKWAELARQLRAQGAAVLVTGGPDEQALAAAVAAAGGVSHVAGKTSFGELAALLARADVVLGPDSGPLNLAVAVGAATVHLFGPADPLIYGPWGPPERHIVLRSDWTCLGCGRFDWPDLPAHGCVRDIPVAAVAAAAAAVLARARA